MHESTEVHHRVPRHLLDAHDRVQTHATLDGVALQLWFEYEGLLLEFGLDPDVSREELEEAIESSAVEVTYEEHRSEIHAADWPRWGRKGGLATLTLYGRGGVHLYFRYPSPQELRAAGLCTREIRNSQGLLGDGLDVRGEGGYVLDQQYSTRLPMAGPVASRGARLAARVPKGGDLRRDPVLKSGPGGLR